ncbi:diguanylate cyclase domain-containing protein [Dapis sp. BLCC M172]|uniref:GGDEF domain-containing response regulator n=1 Tax=Dapis sp. BLCC M172 TaxID=2975281 RepID=UPI003CFB6F5A
MNAQKSQNNSSVIMIVDDEKYMRYLLRKALESEGYKIIEANSGKQCLEKCNIQIPDLILIDAMMPEIDGFVCCIKLQELFSRHLSNDFFPDQNLDTNPLLYQTPLLIITSLEDKESVDLAFTVGAMDYITKPIKWAVLRQRVRRILQINELVKELKQQTETARFMTFIQERIRQSLNLDDILKTTVDEVRKFLKTDRVLIYKFQPDGTGEVVMESVTSSQASVLESMSKFSENAQDKSANQEYISMGDLMPYHVEFLSEFQVKANLVVPISKSNTEQTSDKYFESTQQQLWGLLIAHHCSKPRKWEFSEMDFIECLAGQLAIAIQQSELYQKLETANQKLIELANIDSLTKVANRRVFDEYMDREWRRMAREKVPIALILCDVDYFKRYNDTYGHPAGDRCLQAVANTIKAEVKRPGDLVARYGGEEFVVVLPRTDAQGGFHIAELIRSQLLDLKLVNAGSQISEFVTMSLGVASTIPLLEFSWGKLIKIADEALYQAKAEGRDRTIMQTF